MATRPSDPQGPADGNPPPDRTAAQDTTLVPAQRGFDWLAGFLGFAVSTFFLSVFLGLAGVAVGSVGYQIGARVPALGSAVSGTTTKVGASIVLASLIALFLAYLLGGYTSGRLARHDGVLNGVGVVLWTIIVAVILALVGAGLGAKFDVARQMHLNVDRATLTSAGLISLVVTLAVMLIGSALGGLIGGRKPVYVRRPAGASRPSVA